MKMKEYISERFSIDINRIETKIQTFNSKLFPILNKNY
jgi:hypothetical protein